MTIARAAQARLARIPLRFRLVAAVVVLVAIALGATGVVAATLLRGYLYRRVDAQLVSLSNLETDRLRHGALALHGPALRRGALPTLDYVALVSTGGAVLSDSSSQLSPGQSPPRLPTAALRAATATPFSAPSRRGGARWRVLVSPAPAAGRDVVVAQTLSDANATVGTLIDIEVPVGVLTVLVLAAAGYSAVRSSLRPLREVERAAGALAAGDLARRVDPLDARTEVGRLAASFNAMAAGIQEAFAARERAAQDAAASEERMRRFVADASHELRTPLTSIRGFAELYRQGAADTPAQTAQLLRRIEQEATRMGTLVDDLLLLARLDEQRPLAAEPVDLLELATDTVAGAAVLDPDRPITVSAVPGGAAPVVAGDAGRLRQVLANLLSNARQHTPPGSPITVRVGTVPADGPHPAWAFWEVADRGPGLTREQAARVFERFYRTDTARSRRHGGAGLGLAIVAALVAAHHGEVTVDSAPGAGATFRVLLPLAPSLSGVPATAAGRPPAGGAAAPPRRSPRPPGRTAAPRTTAPR